MFRFEQLSCRTSTRFCFWYKPLTGTERKSLRMRYTHNTKKDLVSFFRSFLRGQILRVEETIDRDLFIYPWPDEKEEQMKFFHHVVPEEDILFFGSRLLGVELPSFENNFAQAG